MDSSQVPYEFLRLVTKPEAQLCYSFTPTTYTNAERAPLLVCLNGLGLPQASWVNAILKLRELRPRSCPAILTYDRYGQGQTRDRDPNDEGAEDPMHAHDCMAAVHDLRQLIKQVTADKMGIPEVDSVPLVLVGNSVGCALSRLYAQEYKGAVAGLVLLDSVLANSDFVSIIPDPDSADFDQSQPLPDGVTPDILRTARAVFRKTFHPENGSKEGLSRRNLSGLLPHADQPRLLEGLQGQSPFVTVVGHDFEAFADGSLAIGMPRPATVHYVNPYWHKYNQGLAKLTIADRSKGPLLAPGADHFIQRDNPGYVAAEVSEVLDKIETELGGVEL